jgi:putative DNA primase/helicase
VAESGGEAAMSETPINRLIGRLQSHGCNPRETGSGQWKSRCPAHNGRSSNLSIKQADDGAVILHCHYVDATGQTCSAEAIVRSLGLEMRDLFPDRLGSPPGKAKAAPSASRNGKGKAWRSAEDAIAWQAKTIQGRVSELDRRYQAVVGPNGNGNRKARVRR